MRFYFILFLLIFVVSPQNSLKLQIQDEITLQTNTSVNISSSGGYG